jgi:hypothetical protein
MQTFLPYPDFKESFRALDNKRLGKQRVEAFQIINAILGRPRKDGKPYKGWLNHPCSVMWKDYVPALQMYYNECVDVWKERGFKNTMQYEEYVGEIVLPPWIGFEKFNMSHRANLLRKDSEYYSKHKWTEDPELPYLWLDENNKWYEQIAGTKQKIYI